MLPPPDAARLFATALGRPGAEQEPAVADIVLRCGFLPIAIRIAAARARSHPAWPLAHLADRLADEHQRLRELRTAESSVGAAITRSYQRLDVAQQRLFRLLTRAPDIDLHTVAALPVAEAERLLDGLLDAHLIVEDRPGHYRCHDLVRLYTPEHTAEHVITTLTWKPRFAPTVHKRRPARANSR